MTGVCCDNQKGNESEFFPLCQVRGPNAAWQLLCSSVLTLLVCSWCLGLCEALDCALLCPDFCSIFCTLLPGLLCKPHWTQQIGLIVTNDYIKITFIFERKKERPWQSDIRIFFLLTLVTERFLVAWQNFSFCVPAPAPKGFLLLVE